MNKNEVEKILRGAKKAIAAAASRQELLNLKATFLGRSSQLQRELKNLPRLGLAERKSLGGLLNRARRELEATLKKKIKELLTDPVIDETLPGLAPQLGAVHPLSQVLAQATDAFSRLGFEIVEGPDVESEANNFDLLNIPADHPARDEWDTFWIKSKTKDRKPKLLLRTHTSPVQIRYMKANRPPLKIIVPGRTYRYEAEDATHASEFWQLEGLVVDEGVAVTHLTGIINYFIGELFPGREWRLRPSFFPFTEPSFEVDMSCGVCRGIGCKSCANKGFLELAGAGMVHPLVLTNSGIDAKRYTGFAFGAGVDRLAMLRYGIDDIRSFFSGDLRFIKQFR